MTLLYVKKCSPNAQLPVRVSDGSAGYDLFSVEEKTIPAHGKASVSTDLMLKIPSYHYGRIASRSGLAFHHNIHTAAGVIDCDYRGKVVVLLINLSNVDYLVKSGDRIAQLIIERISIPTVICVSTLDDTERGTGGFGSSVMD